MAETSLGAAELRFAELIWANAPVSSGELVGLANEAFGWKKSTTYTVLRRLCEKGLFENDGGTGLGLSIVRHAAQNHGARLELKSQPGKGTTITVTF